MSASVPTPELDRMHDARENEHSEAVGAFLDWLFDQGYEICRWQEEGDNGEPRYVWNEGVDRSSSVRRSGGEKPDVFDSINGDAHENPLFEEWKDRFTPARGSINEWLARYFKIDLDKVEAERRALLEAVRSEAVTSRG